MREVQAAGAAPARRLRAARWGCTRAASLALMAAAGEAAAALAAARAVLPD